MECTGCGQTVSEEVTLRVSRREYESLRSALITLGEVNVSIVSDNLGVYFDAKIGNANLEPSRQSVAAA